jgi:hypothetical protein
MSTFCPQDRERTADPCRQQGTEGGDHHIALRDLVGEPKIDEKARRDQHNGEDSASYSERKTERAYG